MNTYNIFDAKEPGTILWHAIAANESQVKEMAKFHNIDISDLTIELQKTNVKNMLGQPIRPCFESALIK